MALEKFPVEVPLGGAVNEGDAPVVVQPPRIREAKDCASIKGGAYQKKDAQTVGQAVNPQTLAIEHTRDATTTFQTTSIEVYPDDGSSNTESYPSPVTGRELRGYSPTESDAVKQHGDHATLELATGEQRTFAAWNADPSGDYRIVQDLDAPVSGVTPETPTTSMYRASENPSSAVYRTEGCAYGIFDGDTQKGPEQPYEELTGIEAGVLANNYAEGAPPAFPKVRADTDNTVFWSACALAYPVQFGSPGTEGYGFTLSTREPPPVPAPGTNTSDQRDVLNTLPNSSNNFGNPGDDITPACKLYVHDVDGVQEAARVTDDTGAQLTPALDLLVVPGEGTYTLHSDGADSCVVRKWQFVGGVIVADPVNPSYTPIGSATTRWPAGLHDTGQGLLIVWCTSETLRVTYDFGFNQLNDPFSYELGITAALPPVLPGNAGEFARQSQDAPPATLDVTSTVAMTRGAWTGSFIAPLNDGSGRLWCGVQMISPPLTPFASTATGGGIYSACVVHALLENDGALVAGAQSVSSFPGAAIASQGAYIEGIGPSVGLYASAPGDDRTQVGQQGPTAFADVCTSTYLLVSRREIEELADVPLPTDWNDGSSAKNQAIAITQLVPQAQAMGTYISNPFQQRTNLFTRSDGRVSLQCFERSAPLAFTTDDWGASGEAATKLSGGASRARPYIAHLDPTADPSTVTAGDYAAMAGAQIVSSGGPQAPAAGWGPQAILDIPQIYGENSAGEREGMPMVGKLTESGVGTASTLFTFAGHAVTYDESGGVHRSVPWQSAATAAYSFSASSDERANIRCAAYPIPYPLLGLSNSRTALIEVYASGPDESTGPQQCGMLEMYPVGTAVWQATIPGLALDPATFLDTRIGSEELLYTSGGELAADAPDPSAALAAANNRLWSVSSINPRQAQYTKLLRRGYAPEWNGNLTVRVPGSEDPLTAVGVLPDGRVLLFSQSAIYYTYGEGPSDTGQGAGFAEPALLTDTVGCENKRSVVFGDFGCMFQGERGFYLVDRGLSLTYVGLPYEDSTTGPVLATGIDGLRSEVIFYSGRVEDGNQQRWVFNYLRQQWSTFGQTELGFAATQRQGRPLLAEASAGGVTLVALTEQPAPVTTVPFDSGLMALTTGWLAMGRIQGFGRVWELQFEGQQQLASASGLRVELSYDYEDAPTETFDYDTPAAAGGRIKIRIRPRRQKCESISVRMSEYVPSTAIPEVCTGWQLEMLTLLCGVKVGLDKVPTTEAST